ncbi:recQ-mediated genome instability protein 1-like isoform X1 [Hylaeus volcanicus]|uniref:recQ-mediated genome instability protein 1-like isoform X1 n=2 Tax=Hylaeus volcanicus TaxID=313075 RepID=UPI0023B81B5F|nr:recQ-mediated genome instability protein 1-like isoform X1 [Hylaeus volcanicus]
MNEVLFKQIKSRLKSEFYLMNDEWLRDCVEFFVDQHTNPSNVEILEFVKVQWQLSNLREINNENGSLPHNIAQQHFVILPDKYILQVEQMYDIATSKYKQLQQIRSTHISEVDPSETEKLEKWEPPKKRMIQLKLTDGVQDVIGIEYSTISRLNDMLLPGYKIMIIGPVKCRKGVLLLEEGKLKGIGGEVDSLLIPNALENVLARALNLQENPDPYNDDESKSNNIQQQKEPEIDDSFFEEDFEINLEEVSKIEHLHSRDDKQTSINANKTEAITGNFTNTSTVNKESHSSQRVIVREQDKSKQHKVNAIKTETVIENFVPINTVNQGHSSKEGIILVDDDDDDCFLEMIDEEQLVRSRTRQTNIAAPFRTLPNEEDDDLIIINDEDMVEDIKHGSIKEHLKKQELLSHSKSARLTSKTAPSTSILRSETCTKTEKTSLPLIGGKRPVPLSPSENVTLKKGKVDRKITEFTKRPKSPDTPKICEFIHDVNNEVITEMTYRTIHGRVEVLGKLGKKDSCWILDATLVDGTGKIEVFFSNKVLEDLLGFSVQEFSLKKKLKKNPEIEQELRKSFRTAEQKIKTLDALLELELNINKKPTVMKIIDLTRDQREIIDKRRNIFLSNHKIDL